MDVKKAIELRSSVREYLSKAVEEEKLHEILEAARLSPSAKNFQERRFVVVTDKATIQKLMVAANNQPHVGEAPVVIACCAVGEDHVMKCGEHCHPIDTAIAIDHMTLRAVELGLGTCWIGSFFQKPAREILGIPDDVSLIELLTVGYPKPGATREKDRMKMGEMVYKERWGKR